MTAQPEGRRRKRIWTWTVLLLVVGGTVAVICWPAPKRPTYEGKTVDEWLRYSDHSAQAERDRAWTSLVRMGAASLPDLERILSQRPNQRRERWKRWMIHLQLTRPGQPDPMPPKEQVFRATRAAWRLAEMGKVDIRSLLPHLTFHLTNSHYGEFARALANCGDEGIAVLTNSLFTAGHAFRSEAALGLRFAKKNPLAISALLRAATVETDRTLRANMLNYLRGSGAPAEQVVPLGLQLLRSEDAYTRSRAAGLLAEYRSSDEVDKALEAVANDPDEDVRRAAAR